MPVNCTDFALSSQITAIEKYSFYRKLFLFWRRFDLKAEVKIIEHERSEQILLQMSSKPT